MNKRKKPLTFIDLFAGIGGFHLAFHRLGAKCVFVSDWDVPAQKTYKENFIKIEPAIFKQGRFVGDITDPKNKAKIPKTFDILAAGFPCQPFSQAGHKRGFDETRGTLFFDIVDIIKKHKPKAIFLENVRHFVKHDGGRTFETVMKNLNQLGYKFTNNNWKIVKASDFGLPTYRPRVYMVAFNESIKNRDQFKFPDPQIKEVTLSDFFGGKWDKKIGYTLRVGGRASGLHDRRNWDTYVVNGKVHRLTVDEAKKIMGFPKTFKFPVSDAQAMKQLGNSVAVNAIQATAREIVKILNNE